jgi:predicted MPP superfamily phosphohydrolase
MLYSLSSLKKKDLKEIQKLEEELGSPLLAFSGVAVDGARMGKEKLRKLQALEEKLGVVLVAVKPS